MSMIRAAVLAIWLWSLGSLAALGAAPVRVGSVPILPRLVGTESIALAQGLSSTSSLHLVAAAGVAGVQVVDLSSLSRPVRVGVWDSPGRAKAVAVAGKLAYVADGSGGLVVVDLSVPGDPRPVGSLEGIQDAAAVAVAGSWLYVADRAGRLVIADLADPRTPRFVRAWVTGEAVNAVVVTGSRLLLGKFGGLESLDVTRPQAPVRLGELRTDAEVLHVVVAGGMAYLADGGSRVRIVEWASDGTLRPRGSVLLEGKAGGLSAPGGRHVYAASGAVGMVAVEVSNPDAPRLASGVFTGGDASAVTVGSGVAFVGDRLGGLRVVLLTNPDRLGAQDVFGRWIAGGRVRDVAADGFLVCTAEGPAGLQAYDVTNPRVPKDLGLRSTELPAVAVAVAGRRAYAGISSETGAGLQILEVPLDGAVDNPPVVLGIWKESAAGTRVGGVVVDGGRAFLAGGAGGLIVVDVTDPRLPVEAGRLRLPGEVLGVAVRAGLAYVANGTQGLKIVDVRDSGAPRLIGGSSGFGPGAIARGVALDGMRAYVASDSYGVQVVDVTDPANPRLVPAEAGGRVDTSGLASRIAIHARLGIVADGESGITVMDLSRDTGPTVVGVFDTGGDAGGVAVANDHVLVADDSRLLVMAVEGLTSGANQPPSFAFSGPAQADEDQGAVVIPGWVTAMAPGPASEGWQSVRLSIRFPVPQETRIFTELPSLSPKGDLRFRAGTNEFGVVNCVVRIEDDGGHENGGVDTFERSTVIEVRPVNDAPFMDSPSDLGWREDSGGRVVFLSGLFPGPANEHGQALRLQAFSSRPEAIPHPEVVYNGGTDATLRFRSVSNWSGRTNTLLAIVLEDDGGTDRGGVNRTEITRGISVRPVNDAPVVAIEDPEDDTLFVLPSGVRAMDVGFVVSGSDEEGPLESFQFFGDGRLLGTVHPDVVRVTWVWEGMTRGAHSLTVVASDATSLTTTSAPVRVFLGERPSIALPEAKRIDIDEDTVSPPLTFRVSDVWTSATNLLVRAIPESEALLPRTGLTIAGLANQRTLTVRPAPNAFGETLIRLEVEDGDGLIAFTNVPVSVRPVNDPPVVALVEPAPDARFLRGQSVRLVAEAGDVEGPVAKVEFRSGSTLLATLSQAPFEFLWTNTPVGVHALTAVVTDLALGGLSATSSPPIVVSVDLPPNQPPDIQGGRPIEVVEDGVSLPLVLQIQDDRTPDASLRVSAVCTDTNLVPTAGLTPTYTGAGWRLVVVPARDAYGAAEIVVTATDAEGLSSVQRLPLTVLAVDDPPRVAMVLPRDGEVFTVGTPIPLLLDASDVDSALNSVAVFREGSTGSIRQFLAPPYEAVWTNAPLGEHRLTARVRSGTLYSTSAPVRIVVQPPPNRAPVLTVAGALETQEDTASGPLEIEVSDENPGTVRLEYEVGDPTLVGAGGVSVTRPVAGGGWRVVVTPLPDRFGTTVLRWVATDEAGASVSRETVLTVLPVNDAPVVEWVAPVEGSRVVEGTTVRLEARARDVEGPVARVEFLVDGVRVGESLGAPFALDWVAVGLGTREVVARGIDGEGLAASSSPVRLVVERPPNRAPVLTVAGALETQEDTASGPLEIGVSDENPGTVRLEYEVGDATLVGAGGVSVTRPVAGGSWQVVVTPLPDRFGTTVLRWVATDEAGASVSRETLLTVLPVNDAPTVRWIAPVAGAVVPPGVSILLEAEASDPEGPPARVEFLDGNRSLAILASAPYRHFWEGAAVGPHDLAAVVVDGEGLAVTSVVARITVTPPANRAPSLVGGGPLTLYRDGASLPIPLTLADDRTPVEALVLSVKASDPVLFPGSGLRLAGQSGQRSLTLVPAPGGFGSSIIELVVADGEGLSATNAFPVTVLPVSELPGGEDCFADRVPEGFGTFNLLKTGAYRQEPGAIPLSLEGGASIELRAPPRYIVSSATVQGAGGFRALLSRREDGLFTWSQRGPEEALLRGLPFGSWTTSFRLVLTNGEALNGFFPFAVVSNVPPVPRVLNLEAGQAINAGSDFALSWVPWTGSGTNDRVILTIVDQAGTRVVSAASDCSGQAVLPRQSAGFEIPGGVLAPGTTYTGYLTFAATQLAVNDRSPLLMLRAFHSRTTEFRLTTGGAGGVGAAFGLPRVFGSTLILTLRGTPGLRYDVEVSPDLMAWAHDQQVLIPAGGTAELALPLGPATAGRFYRAVVAAVGR